MGKHKLESFDGMDPLYELHRDTLRFVTKLAHRDPTIVSEKTADW